MKLFVPIKCTLNLIVLKKRILHKYNLSFQMFSIKKLKASKPKPYYNPLKVKVIGVGDKTTYTTADGKEKKLVPLGVADKEDSIKVSLYEVDKLQLLKAGECVVLSNYVYRVDPHPTIAVTAVTRVMKTSSFAVPEDVETTAKAIANPAPAKIITIHDAKKKPYQVLSVNQRTSYFGGNNSNSTSKRNRCPGTECKGKGWNRGSKGGIMA